MTAVALRSVEDIVSSLRNRAGKPGHVVGVDGFMGSGKTNLAFRLAEALGGIRVSLDTYTSRDAQGESYVSKIMVHFLISDMRKLKAAFPFVIVEGICLRQVLGAISENPDTVVYVKHISGNGLWHDGLHLEDYELDQHNSETPAGLHKNELEYHSRTRPHEIAHIVYERLDEYGS